MGKKQKWVLSDRPSFAEAGIERYHQKRQSDESSRSSFLKNGRDKGFIDLCLQVFPIGIDKHDTVSGERGNTSVVENVDAGANAFQPENGESHIEVVQRLIVKVDVKSGAVDELPHEVSVSIGFPMSDRGEGL